MKLFVVLSAALVAFLAVNGAQLSTAGSLEELQNLLKQQQLAVNAAHSQKSSGNREGRVLAAYSKEISEKTLNASLELSKVKETADLIVGALGNLSLAVNASQGGILDSIVGIQDSLSGDSEVVAAIKNATESLKTVYNVQNNPSSNTSSVAKLDKIIQLVTLRLDNIERIIGYENYPPAPGGSNSTSSSSGNSTSSG